MSVEDEMVSEYLCGVLRILGARCVAIAREAEQPGYPLDRLRIDFAELVDKVHSAGERYFGVTRDGALTERRPPLPGSIPERDHYTPVLVQP